MKIAQREFCKISKKYKKFRNIFVDDWRGYRFVFDTTDVKKCDNNCQKCDLYNLLKDLNKEDVFDPGLILASDEDKKIFGQQNFLNCKTINQYQNCFINFIFEKNLRGTELVKELKLVANLKLIYTKDGDISKIEKKFKEDTIRKIKNKF